VFNNRTTCAIAPHFDYIRSSPETDFVPEVKYSMAASGDSIIICARSHLAITRLTMSDVWVQLTQPLRLAHDAHRLISFTETTKNTQHGLSVV